MGRRKFRDTYRNLRVRSVHIRTCRAPTDVGAGPQLVPKGCHLALGPPSQTGAGGKRAISWWSRSANCSTTSRCPLCWADPPHRQRCPPLRTSRALYEARRDEQIPAHRLRLALIRSSDLDAGGRGRLRRNETADLAALKPPTKDGQPGTTVRHEDVQEVSSSTAPTKPEVFAMFKTCRCQQHS